MAFPDKKPTSDEIVSMVKKHFDREAKDYDDFDKASIKRSRYTNKVNSLVADGLTNLASAKKLLSVACGTGRREVEIQKLTGLEFDITGVELSGGMAKEATKNGIHCLHSSWLDVEVHSQFDAALFLYSFGAFSSANERRQALKKLSGVIRRGGLLFIDAHNLDDENEWGPAIRKEFDSKNLEKAGYELGDLFYRKVGEKPLSFWHYFTASEIGDLITSANFKIEAISFIGYGKNHGEIVESNAGAILIKAVRL